MGTYFAMPAIFNSLVQRGLTPHTAWRVAFVVPGILIVSTAALMLLLTDDCPTGKWSEREQAAQANFRAHSVSEGAVVNVPGASSDSNTDVASNKDYKVGQDEKFGDHEAHIGQEQMEEAARGEVIEKPSLMQIVKVCFSLQVLVCGACYLCSFGGELAFNSILGSYYRKNFPELSQQDNGNWAAMFGLLNVAFRPLGGVIADVIYKKTSSVWSKRVLLHTYVTITGALLIVIGKLDSHHHSTMFGLVAAMAFFMDGANGLNFPTCHTSSRPTMVLCPASLARVVPLVVSSLRLCSASTYCEGCSGLSKGYLDHGFHDHWCESGSCLG